jgi:ABC-type multidrug transport system fused ATPase/permease subunit
VLTLPDTVPVAADLRSPGRFLLSLARRQWRTLVVGMGLGVVWTLAQALTPWAVGRTIDDGVAARDGAALARWCAVLLALGLLQTLTGVLRHRFAVANWLQGCMRCRQLVGHHVADAGTAVAAGTTTGEVVSTVANDAHRVGDIFDVSQRFVGAVVAFVVVAALLVRLDVGLGLLVLLGVPAVTAGLGLVVRPLNLRQQAQRDAEGRLTALGSDTVAGLRVLRGIGGEEQFVARYRERSQAVRQAGVRIAGVQATLDAAQVLLPGTFVVVLTWLGAHAALAGRITPGGLVTLYGYAAFLVMPLGTATETLGKAVRARVAAGRIVAVLRRTPRHAGRCGTAVEPPAGVVLEDPVCGLRVEPGLLTALVAPVTEDASALAHRLARLDDDLPGTEVAGSAAGVALPTAEGSVPGAAPASPRLGGVPVDDLPVEVLRRRVLVSEAEPRLFTGTLRAGLDPGGRHRDADLFAALHVADAHDVLDALPDGLDAQVEERGRSFSGGQRQRLVLARAVLSDPDVLVLVEPTSAVDAHTEARVAQRLARARSGRTTLVTTASPLLLDHADRVAFLVGGRVVAEGTHRDLLHAVPAYRDTVIRGEDES